MPIKFRFSAPLLVALQAKHSGSQARRLAGLLLLTCFFLFPASARAEQALVGVVKSEENASQWQGITKRLQDARVAYCVIPLPAVDSATKLGDRPVVFLPNIETLTAAQAMALEEWMSRGGRVIASGPVGTLSQPGVRQLLQLLFGAYWGFNLSTPSKLQPLQIKGQEWAQQNGLSGTVQGGVVIPTSLTSKPAAVWQSRNNPPAVVTTERSTIFGWRWGVNAASVELDSGWLRAALSRYVQLSEVQATNANSTASPKNCDGTTDVLAAKPKPATPIQNTASIAPPTPQLPNSPTPQLPNTLPLRTSPIPQLPNPTSRTPPATPVLGGSERRVPQTRFSAGSQQSTDEPLDRIVPPGLGVTPDSQEPISTLQASALQQELENLIGRFESAQLTANAVGSKTNGQHNDVQVASSGSLVAGLSESAQKVVVEAREIAKALPQLVDGHNYTAARQQWLKAQQLLWNNFPTNRSLAQPEIRAIWLDRGSIVRAGSERELAKIFDRLAAAGINTVFLETINAGYPIYPSRVAPQQNPLIRGWDPLASGVKLAHERGMELHAWVWAFAVGNRRHNALVNLPADYPGPVIAAHPDWASYDNRGSLFPPGQGKPFLDPANPEARQYLLSLLDEIVSRYQVDGLQLDYIRYPFQDPSADRTYGYGKAARQQFQQSTGVDPLSIRPSDRNLWQKWTEFRAYKVDSFVADVSRQLRQKRPNLILSVAVFPLSEHDRIYKLQQHWEVWANRGDVDLIVPMTYALDTYRFQRLAQPWLTSDKLGSTLILPGIRLLNLPLAVAIDQIQLARDLPVSGYSLFAVNNLSNELQNIFHSTQGTVRSIPQDPVPYRQPFQTAAARYAALQREWSFLLGNKQLWLRQQELSAFSSQSKILASALNQLAENPSPSQLEVAKASLSAFQSQFDNWMRLQALENPYQVKVWQNRLSILERLLLYGERVVLKREVPPVAEQQTNKVTPISY